MDQVEEKEIEISREYDYSNSVPEVQSILILAKYCYSYYGQLIKMCEEDEEKNKILKSEYKDFLYKKSFASKYEVAIREKGNSFSNLSCKTYDSFVEAVNSGHLNNVESVVITLDLSFKRGKDMATKEHENLFKISFKPYSIVFIRKSNHADSSMDNIENVINEILKKFRVQNTIFCTKE